jgi:hypothetical protein
LVLQDFEVAQNGVNADQEQYPNVEHDDGIKDLDVIPRVPFAERFANYVTVIHPPHLL